MHCERTRGTENRALRDDKTRVTAEDALHVHPGASPAAVPPTAQGAGTPVHTSKRTTRAWRTNATLSLSLSLSLSLTHTHTHTHTHTCGLRPEDRRDSTKSPSTLGARNACHRITSSWRSAWRPSRPPWRPCRAQGSPAHVRARVPERSPPHREPRASDRRDASLPRMRCGAQPRL